MKVFVTGGAGQVGSTVIDMLLSRGDKVTAIMAPLKDGRPGGLLLEVVLPSGKHMLPGVPNAERYKRTS